MVRCYFSRTSTQEDFEKRINRVGIENVTEINIYCCKKITYIHHFPNLIKLVCDSSAIVSIPSLENLEILTCYDCIDLIEIGHLPKLKYLDCSATKIKSIPFMENLKELLCDNCENLIKIPNFPKLEKLNCSRCNIRYIPLIKSITNLNCFDCANIFEISYFFENIKNLVCDIDNKRIKIYSKDLTIRDIFIRRSYDNTRGKMYQNIYRMYELLIM